MDNDYKYIKLLTLDGWASLNSEHIESVKRIGRSVKVKMISGDIHLLHLTSQINKLQKIISTKI